MLKAILILLALAFITLALTAAGVLPLPSIVPYVLFAGAMILALFTVMTDGNTKEL